VDGTFEGVFESEHDLAIGAHGKIKGLIKANHIVVTGVVEGKVVCDHLEILSSGKFIGELVAGDMSIEKGAKFIGRSHEVTDSGAVITFDEKEKRTIIQHPETIEQLVESVAEKPKNLKHIEPVEEAENPTADETSAQLREKEDDVEAV